MWYTGTSSSIKMTPKQSAIVHELGTCLAEQGWKLRTGGRGEFDDVLHQAAEMAGGTVKTILPFGFYRDYNANKFPETTVDFSKFDDIYMERCFAQAVAPNISANAHTPLQRNLLGSTVPMLLGENLDMPSRFVITWNVHLELSRDDALAAPVAQLRSPDSPLIELAKNRHIPVFNLADPEHMERILSFIRHGRKTGAAAS